VHERYRRQTDGRWHSEREREFTFAIKSTLCPEKDTKMFFKLGRFRWNLVSFMNDAKSCKRFPPHLNTVSTLPCENWNAHSRERAISALSEKVTLKFIPPGPPNSPDLNPVDYSVWEYCDRRCTKRTSLIWTYRRRHWLMAIPKWRHDPDGPLSSQSLFQFVKISDEYFEHLLLQYSPHSIINSNLSNLEATVRWNKFWSFFL